jgi:hypothetical protein
MGVTLRRVKPHVKQSTQERYAGDCSILADVEHFSLIRRKKVGGEKNLKKY